MSKNPRLRLNPPPWLVFSGKSLSAKTPPDEPSEPPDPNRYVRCDTGFWRRVRRRLILLGVILGLSAFLAWAMLATRWNGQPMLAQRSVPEAKIPSHLVPTPELPIPEEPLPKTVEIVAPVPATPELPIPEEPMPRPVASSPQERAGALFSPSREIPAAQLAPLKYAWQADQAYPYQFTIEANVGDATPVIRGLVSYEPTDEAPKWADPQSDREDSGIAFLVSSNGVLLTCAHVVRGAVHINAHFGEDVYTAEVMVFDPAHDLALLKIKASDMPYLPLGDSDQMRPGQRIDLVGTSPTAEPGRNLQLAQGTVSAIPRKGQSKLLQLDVDVSPENSGSPLIDNQGRVVGIASALVGGQNSGSVGLAVPSNDGIELLKSKQIEPRSKGLGTDLDPIELRRRVAPSLARLKILSGPGGIGLSDPKVVRFNGRYSLEGASRQLAGSRATPPANQTESGKMVVDSRGEVLFYQGGLELPLIFQVMGKLGIESLPCDGRRWWKTWRPVIIVQRSSASPNRSPDPDLQLGFGGPDAFYDHRHPLSPKLQEHVLLMPAVEEATYETRSESGDGTVVIGKKYELTTLPAKGQTRSLQMKGSGETLWDKNLGASRSTKFRADVTLADGKTTLAIPVALRYELDRQAAGGSAK